MYQTLNQENVDICLLQEVEITKDYPTQLLSNRNYKLEIEAITSKARCAIAIKNNIDYTRRNDLEDEDLGLMVIDVNSARNFRIVNVYRQFNPPNNITQKDHFELQLQKINNLCNNLNGRKILIAGDFNLDDSKRYAIDYRYKTLFEG